jgi:hypothetical protein
MFFMVFLAISFAAVMRIGIPWLLLVFMGGMGAALWIYWRYGIDELGLGQALGQQGKEKSPTIGKEQLLALKTPPDDSR